MVHHFLYRNPYKMSIFERSVPCSFLFRNCTHILTGTQEEKFEDMFLVKTASKGTSLRNTELNCEETHWDCLHRSFFITCNLNHCRVLHRPSNKSYDENKTNFWEMKLQTFLFSLLFFRFFSAFLDTSKASDWLKQQKSLFPLKWLAH